jgi:hypothetical protein
MSVIVDQTGPTYQDELEFDFTDPDKFELTGIVEDLTVDLRFRLQEYDEFVDSCLGDPPCQQNEPGNPVDASSVWALDPWTIEYNIAAAARNEYLTRVYEGSWLLGAAKILIGKNGDPPGWIVYDIPVDFGLSPEDQWLWETVLEVGQVALHDTPYSTFAEGTADVAFTVHEVHVGLTGSEAAEAVRPFLQEQSALLSDFLLGDFKKNNDHVDFYYARAIDSEPYVYFVLPEELRDGEPYTYARPGFYRSSTLDDDDKISQTVIAGLVDTTHEKLRVPVGETVAYYEDDGGMVYRIRIERAEGSTDAKVAIAQRLD